MCRADGERAVAACARLGHEEIREVAEAVCDGAATIAGRDSIRAWDGGGEPPFRALQKLFKQRLGTKVRNKLARNRGEALGLEVRTTRLARK